MGSEADNTNGVNGNTVEIFVFSNGEKDSPPRKYNLRVNERWNTTMNFLARSQYGSKLTVDLYTIEGKKLEGPQELTAGAAYVAVEPPQPFAPAGYHQYLMKASRSREKRQERITEKESLIRTVKLNIEDKNEENHKDSTTIDHLTIVAPNSILAEEQDVITENVKSDIVKAVRPIRRISTIKQSQKKNSSLPQHNSPIIRNKINNITTPVRKTNNTSRVDEITKKFELLKSTKKPITPIIQNKPENTKISGVRLASYNKQHAESSVLQRETDVASHPDRPFAGFKEKQNLTVDSSTSTTSAIIERHVLHVLPVLVDGGNDQPKSDFIYLNKQPSNTGTSYISKNGVCILSKDGENPQTIINNTENPQVGSSKAKATTEALEEFSQNEMLIFGNQTGNKNFAIYVKKGDSVNLKLNIEVISDSTAVIETNHIHHLKETISITSTHKYDRGTLANNTAVASNGCEAPGIGEPYLGALSFEQLQQMTNGLKFAVCGIDCCSCSGTPKCEAPVYVDNNNYIILLSPDTKYESSESCACNITKKSKSDVPDNQDQSRRSKSNIGTIEEETKAMKEEDITANDVTAANENRKSVTSLSINMNRVEIEYNQLCECCETCKVLKLPPACNCVKNTLLECPADENEIRVPTDFVVNQPLTLNNNGNIYKEAFTQTVWTCVVLEARPRGDGSYAFHLPSLEILKLCNVLY